MSAAVGCGRRAVAADLPMTGGPVPPMAEANSAIGMNISFAVHAESFRQETPRS